MRYLIIGTCLLIMLSVISGEILPWLYQCDTKHDRCLKIRMMHHNDIENGAFTKKNLTSFAKCKLTCRYSNDVAQEENHGPDEAHYSTLWPRPREVRGLGNEITYFHPENIRFQNRRDFRESITGHMLQRNIDEQIGWLFKKNSSQVAAGSRKSIVALTIALESDSTAQDYKPRIRKDVDEEYTLNVSTRESKQIVDVVIGAKNYFGARHGLETLFQLVEYDDVEGAFAMVSSVSIRDYPEFSHRGVSVDTSRSFIEPTVLKRLIDGLAQTKMNVFHWHIVDTHSFPMELRGDAVKKITEFGAYSKDKIYSQETIKEIVDYANYRGVRVIPELDQPSHVGNGWNFPGGENLTVCVNKEPWFEYCLEPPCGQINPTEPDIYDLLEEIYVEMVEMFDFDQLHMGADEVHFGCWNSSAKIRNWMLKHGINSDEAGFIKLWKRFQVESSQRLYRAYGKPEHSLDLIIWTSHLTQGKYLDHSVPPSRYIVQIWSDASNLEDPQIQTLTEKGYRMIFSNHDALYMDCGFASWVGPGTNWCSPYKGWREVYMNDPYLLLEQRGIEVTDAVKRQVLGGETAVWSETVDSAEIEARMFPRALALGERLWSNPGQNWYQAQSRLLHHRERLLQREVRAGVVQPEWCEQNENMCYNEQNKPSDV